MPSASERALESELQPEPANDAAALVRRVLLGELTPEEACERHRLTPEQLKEWIRIHRRTVRRSIDEQIAATLSAQGLEREDFVLSGNLQSMALSDLLETIQLGRKHAYIRIEHEGECGRLWCSDGDVIDARFGAEVGSPAVYQLLALKEGRLQADFSPVVHERTILASTQELLVEYARRSDELERLHTQLGDTARVLWQNTRDSSGPGLAPRERDVLRAFDGVRSIADVAALLQRPELETLTVIARLLETQWLIASPPQPEASAPERSPPPMQRAAQPGYASRAPASRAPASSRASVPPAPSVTIRRSVPVPARRYGAFATAAACCTLLAFVAGWWTARPPAAPVPARPAAAPSPVEALESALCGSAMKLFTSASLPRSLAAGRAPLAPFCLAREAVSANEYRACVTSQGCEPAHSEGEGESGQEPAADPGAARCNFGQPGREQYPINCVTQRQAEQYCQWRGQRLPQPDEWELAWQALHAPQSAAATAQQDSSSRRIGDISEWTKDRSDAPQRAAPPGQEQALYAVMRVARSLNPAPSNAPPSRLYVVASAQARGIGFRCALSLQTPPPR